MKIDILSLFPEMFKGPFDESIIKRSQDKKLAEINIHNIRKWAQDKHKTVDDRPYGGGVGMVLKVEPIYSALKDLRGKETKVILLSPQGKVFNQKKARNLSQLKHIVLIAGHYEGFDERIRQHLVDEEISIGDYVLTGGELPAMIVTDAVVRLIPGVLAKAGATEFESFSPATYNLQPTTLLEYPQYTHPSEFMGWKVPRVLLSGNHKEIEGWRKQKALMKTKKTRPDLLEATKELASRFGKNSYP